MSRPENDSLVSITFDPNITRNTDGSWRVSYPHLRLNVDTPPGMEQWKNVEMTGYVRVVSTNSSILTPNNITENLEDEDDESSHSTTATLTIAEPDPNRFSPIGGGVYFPTESIPNPDRLEFGPFGIPLPNQANEEFRPSEDVSASTAEQSSCKIVGTADGILQKFDASRYQACGLNVNGQKAYSDGFVVGCTQIGNTQLICQAFVDSSVVNTKIQATQAPTQQIQGIQPAVISK
ncbi:MAG: hypothetical protein ACRD8W_01865 [Nitrososphaeraceae archaeon]